MADDDLLELSRSELLAAASTALTEGPEGLPERLAAHALVVARADLHLEVTSALEATVRKAEVWISSGGVVALAHQEDHDVPGPVLGSTYVSSYQAVVSAASLEVGALRAPEGLEVPGGLLSLLERVVAGDLGSSRLSVLDWRQGDERERWVIVDLPEGRVAAFGSSSDPVSALALEPVSPMDVARAIAGLVGPATEPDDDGSDADPAPAPASDDLA